MEVQPNEDGTVHRMPFWHECLDVKPGCDWKWTPWFWVWGRGSTVREVREARQRLVWRCHSGRSASYGGMCLYLGSDLDIVQAITPAVLIKNVDMWTWSKTGCLWCQNGVIISLVCTNKDESFSTPSCLLGQHLGVNKSYGDYDDIVRRNLVFRISVCFCLKDNKLHCG